MPDQSTTSDYMLRVRFKIPDHDHIGVDSSEIELRAADRRVVLKSEKTDVPIRDAEWLVVLSSGWQTEQAAKEAANAVVGAIGRSLACNITGADFGSRAPQGGFFEAGLKMLEGLSGGPVLNDNHGAMVFPTSLKPKFARLGPIIASKIINGERWAKTFSSALERCVPFSEREATAFDLFTAAHSAGTAIDARFVLLFAAIEVLLEDEPRPQATVDHVDQLIALTEKADQLDRVERVSLLGSLQWLRSHSIRSAGRKFVRERLGGRKYNDQDPDVFFLKCYEMRSRLMHGDQPFPSRNEVTTLEGGLNQMVGHLLAGPVLQLGGY